jgi:hypothetical protein
MEQKLDISQKAEKNLKGLVNTLYKLLIVENKQFDLVVAPGTTGVFVCKLAEMIYHKLRKPFPSKIILPIVRYKGAETPENLFDNSVLLPQVIKQLKGQNLGFLEEILFVDDEIYGGNALRECLKLVLRYKAEKEIRGETACTIVAEDQGMSCDYTVPGVTIKFEFYERGIDEYNNAITYYLPYELEKPITGALGDKIGTHAVVNILLNLPIKPKGNNQFNPEFTYEFHKIAREKISSFDDLQTEAQAYTSKLIDQAIEETKNR